MKSRKRIWIAALCLLSVTVITISLKAWPRSVLAAQHSVSPSINRPARCLYFELLDPRRSDF